MNPGTLLRGFGLGLAAMALNILVAFLVVWIYSIAVAPGHDRSFYEAFAQRAAPISGIVAGLPILFAAGYLAARRAAGDRRVAASIPALTYIAVDGALIAGFMPGALSAWAVFLISWLTKVGAAGLGGRAAMRRLRA